MPLLKTLDISHIKHVTRIVLAWCFITFGQPAYSTVCSFFASTIGFALIFYELTKFERKARFIYGTVFFFLVQCVELFWFTYHPVVAARSTFLLISTLMGLQFGVLALLVTKRVLASNFLFLLIPAAWTILEWSRLFWCSGFYFDLVGLSLASNLATLQTASLFGLLGMSFWVMLTNACVARAFLVRKTAAFIPNQVQELAFLQRENSEFERSKVGPYSNMDPLSIVQPRNFGAQKSQLLNLIGYILAIVTIALPFIYGSYHLHTHILKQAAYDAIHPRMKALIVHSKKVPEEFKPLPRVRLAPQQRAFYAWKELITAIAPFYKEKIDLILMPEGVVPYGSNTLLFDTFEINSLFLGTLKAPFPITQEMLLTSEDIASEIAQLYNCPLIIGLEGIKHRDYSDRPLYYNSAFFFSNDPKVPIQRYDKQVLVPMGEYIPCNFAKKWAAKYGIYDSFTPGEGAKPFKSGKHRIGASICYEETVSSMMRQNSIEGATMLVNLTDDYWFPYSTLAIQHFEHARPRTVENGIPLIRSCNFGISGVVDSLGRVVDVREGPDEASGFIVSFSTYHYPTLYTQFGDWPVLILSLSIILIGIYRFFIS